MELSIAQRRGVVLLVVVFVLYVWLTTT